MNGHSDIVSFIWSVAELLRGDYKAADYGKVPDLNPIEQAFATLKTLLRRENARTVAQTTHCIGKLIDQITRSECINYFRKAGYST
ncbi:MAG: hypothetical protein LGL72_18620 [Acidibrevibacterium sp.]|uniref:hypothetical protein n=1 Tax=Acidibrevibacterium fodinaquatile TaxID=1969806 RepID=UPI0023A8B65D|nr:hypothetical protein [Acidibrevibacterium fodinaquatile]MCA7121351.1 hypothetical protein [Acidibrevibacterium fodinaquatile]